MPDPESSVAIPGSVSRLLPGLRRREPGAVNALWERYFQPLVGVARARMNPALCRSSGPEDVAQDVILEFCRLLADPGVDSKFPRLATRQNLWGVLVRLTMWEASDKMAKLSRQANIVAGESGFGSAGPDGVATSEPAPEFAAAVNELLDQLVEPEHPEQGKRLQTVARMVMEGYTHAEIATRLHCSEKTVGRKLELIRKIWRQRDEQESP